MFMRRIVRVNGASEPKKSESRNHRVDPKGCRRQKSHFSQLQIGDPIFVKWPSLRLRIHQELRTEEWEASQVLKIDAVFEDTEAFTSCTVELRMSQKLGIR